MYELRGRLANLIGNLSLLEHHNWIDRQTRAVMAEFSVFNPNINLICVCTIVFEFLATGTIIKKADFQPLNLFNETEGGAVLTKNLFYFIYMCIIIIYMITNIRDMCKQRREYFTHFWSYVDWAIIIMSWAGLAMFIVRVHTAYEVKDFFKKTSGYGYIKLQYISYWNDLLSCFIAFCAALGTLKFMRLLRFNARMRLLASTIRSSIKELAGFGILSGVIWFGFVQVFYLLLIDKIYVFSTLLYTVQTSFEMILGRFQVEPLVRAHSTLGPLLYVMYNLVVVFVFLNIFISIVDSTFIMVKRDSKKQPESYDFVEYFSRKVDDLLVRNKSKNLYTKEAIETYKDHITLFPEKLNKLSDSLIKVIFGDYILGFYFCLINLYFSCMVII